ncbi:hypothetical protein C4579_00555 [Candidatus Microgenomates bacterium]|nr:MAG: hypothetical protein C4579_00555 [Candidatus Microgenomates bacterium]
MSLSDEIFNEHKTQGERINQDWQNLQALFRQRSDREHSRIEAEQMACMQVLNTLPFVELLDDVRINIAGTGTIQTQAYEYQSKAVEDFSLRYKPRHDQGAGFSSIFFDPETGMLKPVDDESLSYNRPGRVSEYDAQSINILGESEVSMGLERAKAGAAIVSLTCAFPSFWEDLDYESNHTTYRPSERKWAIAFGIIFRGIGKFSVTEVKQEDIHRFRFNATNALLLPEHGEEASHWIRDQIKKGVLKLLSSDQPGVRDFAIGDNTLFDTAQRESGEVIRTQQKVHF